MISLQKLFSKDDTFFSLLEASAEEGRNSIHSLNNLLAKPWEEISTAAFHQSKEADKRITEQINEALVTSFVTALEKEDIEALSAALYRIPKTVEKFVERFAISGMLVKGIDFSRHITLLSAATEQVVTLIRTLRGLGSGQVAKAKECNQRLQQIEGDADKLMLEFLRDLYSGRHDPLLVVIVSNLYDLLEKIFDRCRDVGNVAKQIAYKNS
jgi:uncharacterized protein Yka (UPF0111/DUF47 family)